MHFRSSIGDRKRSLKRLLTRAFEYKFYLAGLPNGCFKLARINYLLGLR